MEELKTIEIVDGSGPIKKEVRLYVPVGKQRDAFKNGAIFVRKSIFDSKSKSHFEVGEYTSDEDASVLIEKFGENSVHEREKAKAIAKEWIKQLKKNNFDCLLFAKENGLPKEEPTMEKLFLKFMNRSGGDYPIHWEDLCLYLPEFKEHFGQDRYLSLHKQYDLCGDMVEAIKNSGMSNLDKYFLYFVYETSE